MKNIDKLLLLSLLVGYTGKVCILGASPSDAAIVLVLAAAHIVNRYYDNNKEITELKGELTAIKDALVHHAKEIQDLKTTSAGMKLASGMRQLK
jgi:predicted ribonuclease toxin of YeeF-YezG toxin-antitoxin module